MKVKNNATQLMFIVFTIYAFFTLPGCSNHINQENEFDDYLSINNTCNPPCLYGIVPGVTKVEDAIQILNELSPDNPDSDLKIGIEDISWQESKGKNIYFKMQAGIVARITFKISLRTRNAVYLNQIIEQLGEPEAYSIEFPDEEGDGHVITIFYPSQGVIATFVHPGSGVKEDVYPTMKANIIYFIANNDDLDSFLGTYAASYHVAVEDIPTWLFDIYVWEGYGDFPSK